jgi:hypothetical protein
MIDKFCSLDSGKIEVRFKESDIQSQRISFKKRSRFLNWMRGIG